MLLPSRHLVCLPRRVRTSCQRMCDARVAESAWNNVMSSTRSLAGMHRALEAWQQARAQANAHESRLLALLVHESSGVRQQVMASVTDVSGACCHDTCHRDACSHIAWRHAFRAKSAMFVFEF